MTFKKILFFVFIMFQSLFAASSTDTVGVLERSLNLSSKTTSDAFMRKDSSFVDKSIKKKEALSGNEIDKIFISFEEEKRRALERKRAKKKKEEELAAKKSEREASLLSRSSSSLVATPASVFPKTDVEAEKRRIISGAYTKRKKKEKKKTVRRKARKLPNLFYGTSCINGECVVFTPYGTLKEGDTVIPSGEKIKVIKPYYVKTNLREILL